MIELREPIAAPEALLIVLIVIIVATSARLASTRVVVVSAVLQVDGYSTLPRPLKRRHYTDGTRLA